MDIAVMNHVVMDIAVKLSMLLVDVGLFWFRIKMMLFRPHC